MAICIWEHIEDRRIGVFKSPGTPLSINKRTSASMLWLPVTTTTTTKISSKGIHFRRLRSRFATEPPWSTFKLIFYVTGSVLSSPPPSKDLLTALPKRPAGSTARRYRNFPGYYLSKAFLTAVSINWQMWSKINSIHIFSLTSISL